VLNDFSSIMDSLLLIRFSANSTW